MYIYDRQLTGPENKPITSGPEFQLDSLARNVVGRLNTNLADLATKLKTDDALCKKMGTLRVPATGVSRSQPLAYAYSAAFGEPPTTSKAKPTISKVAADRINRVAKTMTEALQLATEAAPFLKTPAQRELLQQMTEGLRTFFPTGFGVLNQIGAEAAREFPSRGAASLLNLSGFAAHRAKMESHFAKLIAVLEKQANVRFEGNMASFIADKLLEEVLAYVFTARVGEAMAEADARKMAKKTRGPGAGISVGFVPTTFLRNYIRRHWLRDLALRTALETAQAGRVISDMSDDLRAIVSAMETIVGA